MATTHHSPPTRSTMIRLVRERGAKFVYGPAWGESDTQTVQQLMALSDVEYMRQCGCDNCDEQGRCLGHEKPGVRL